MGINITQCGCFIILKISTMSRIGNYFRDTAAEMKHVKWPTQKQAFIYTILVIVISGLVALFLSAFDYIFTTALNAIIK